MKLKLKPLVFLWLLTWACTPQQEEEKEEVAEFKVPVEYYKLNNGLKVILSEDKNGTYRGCRCLLQYRFQD